MSPWVVSHDGRLKADKSALRENLTEPPVLLGFCDGRFFASHAVGGAESLREPMLIGVSGGCWSSSVAACVTRQAVLATPPRGGVIGHQFADSCEGVPPYAEW
jgi:hypothetical protein